MVVPVSCFPRPKPSNLQTLKPSTLLNLASRLTAQNHRFSCQKPQLHWGASPNLVRCTPAAGKIENVVSRFGLVDRHPKAELPKFNDHAFVCHAQSPSRNLDKIP